MLKLINPSCQGWDAAPVDLQNHVDWLGILLRGMMFRLYYRRVGDV